VDGIAIMTSLGRKSPVFGNATGGSGSVVTSWRFEPYLTPSRSSLIPPRGYSIAGVTGSCGQWVDGFGILLTR
jgi:hypothetical protein